MMKTYKIDEKTNLIIEDSVILKLNEYSQGKGMYESGGILLGKVKADFSEYIITNISEPCNEDGRGRCFFVRSKDNAQKIINDFWRSSCGEIMYFGEWHTHPELYPSPSYVDRKLIKQCSVEIKPLPAFIFLIIVAERGSLYVGCKNVSVGKNLLVKLDEVEGEK
ncbi:Mov34/MPN/PAD-1 family protein [uncultured Clostridium sp.]|uniref:Mov34/MPN/PAD-1 family protein n=1 Tax=uncultured Clostridium sp. TaxID=59620 RepID=UPI0032175400